MTYRVVWPRPAIEALANAYLAAEDRGEAAAVTAAMAEVDRLLEIDPTTAGESRAGNDRVLIVPPVVVEYEVVEEEFVAVVKHVRYRGRA